MKGLYIHIPFCFEKCYYCDFTSYVRSEHLMDYYVDALLKEMDLYKEETFDTVFLGGGTPSYLNEYNLKKILSGINNIFNKSKILEFTVECNPGTLNYDKLTIMKNYGVNRLSIGVQSANDNTLKFIGRTHKFIDFDRNFNLACKVGFENINIDLIFAIPCEGINSYKRTLDFISSYNLSHISAYNLILEKNTKFYLMFKQNKFKELKEDIQFDMYEYTKNFLENIGFIQYEVSNYAKEDKQCLHNLIYWNFNDYIGVGVSAHSFYNGSRFENTKNLKEYINMLSSGRHEYIMKTFNSIEDNIEEYIMLGLRKVEGISLKDFEDIFKRNIFDLFGSKIRKHEEDGLIYYDDFNLCLTSKGIILMNYVLKDFIFDKERV